MARFTEGNDRIVVDQLVDTWRTRCLIGEGSLLRPDEELWTGPHLATLTEHFVDAQLEDERGFEEKLTTQLRELEPEPVRLMAEVIAMYLAFAALGTVGAERKRALVELPLGLIDERLDAGGQVSLAMAGGIGGPGQGFNSYRPNLLSYLIRFGAHLKAETDERRRELLTREDPEPFKAWLDERLPDAQGGGRTMRNILLHLLFPDRIERIAVDDDKAQIVNALHGLVDGLDPQTTDGDEALWAIRQRLVQLMPDGQSRIDGAIDFYYTPLREAWDPDTGVEGRRTERGLSHVQALEYKRQVVLYGPPGTGKTHEAKALAEQLIRRRAMQLWGPVHYLANDGRVRELIGRQVQRRQLHPAYSYEDFIGGLRLVDNETKPTKGHLLQLVERIEHERESCTDPAPLPWVLILDEINRADLSRLLGEVFSALDDRDAAIELSAPGAEAWGPFVLPHDLYVIGTMNLIDQSVEQLDFALRRRFFWLLADYREDLIVPVVKQRWEALDLDARPWLRRHGWEKLAPDVERLAARTTALNATVRDSPLLGPQYELGHAYFFEVAGLIAEWSALQPRYSRMGNYLWSATGKALAPLENLWQFSLAPLLDEYLAGVAQQQRDRQLDELRALFLAPVAK